MDLTRLQANASFDAEFKRTAKESFASLNDKNAALYMLLQFIDCSLREGKVGEQVAQQMAEFVRTAWYQTLTNERGTPPPALSRVEVAALQAANYKDLIYARFREFGIPVPVPSDANR